MEAETELEAVGGAPAPSVRGKLKLCVEMPWMAPTYFATIWHGTVMENTYLSINRFDLVSMYCIG